MPLVEIPLFLFFEIGEFTSPKDKLYTHGVKFRGMQQKQQRKHRRKVATETLMSSSFVR